MAFHKAVLPLLFDLDKFFGELPPFLRGGLWPRFGSSMSVLVWNCQGLGNPDTRKRLRELVFKHHVSVVYLMETKQKKSFLEKIRNNLGFSNHHYFKPVGRGGGLALWWRQGIQIEILDSNQNYIDAKLNWIADEPWWCTFYYGPPTDINKQQIMNTVAALRRDEEKAWMVIGDFNIVKNGSEKIGGRKVDENNCKLFEDWVDDCGFDELNVSGGRFTWSNNRVNNDCILEKLDRIFFNPEWSNLFLYANSLVEPAIYSDHATVILALFDQKRSRVKSFKFETKWLEEEELTDVVQKAWHQEANSEGRQALSMKMNAIRTKLKAWSRKKFINPKKEINRLSDRVAEIKQNILTDDLKAELTHCIDRMEKLKRVDEKHWFSRARIKWLNYGGRNSKFFHATTVRRRFNTIRRLKNSNGQWIEDTDELNKMITGFYDDQFKRGEVSREEEVLNLITKKVDAHMNQELKNPITDREIRDAVFNLGAHKAPGPDGYNGVFYHKFWSLIKESVMSMVRSFFNSGRMPDDTNKANLVLIPKIDNPETVGDFRPIGCCNFSYKIIARIITSRMKAVMSHVISPMQAAFVPGRQIQDNLIIAHEVFNGIKGRVWGDKGVMAIKLDLAKAYDKVDWSFLRKVMLATGFDGFWTDRVMECITSANLTVTVNGEDVGSINPGRGLRQGDPMSPCLFNLIANIISVILEAKIASGEVKGYRINKRCPTLSHLLFADDCLIFGEATVENAEAIREALELFQTATGQKVNYLKSSVLCSSNTTSDTVTQIMSKLQIKKMESNATYLGLPTVWGRGKRAALGFLKEKVNTRISSWRGKFLSQAGKEVLIKSVVSAMSVYVMQVFKIPKTFCSELNVLLNRFWWGRSDDISKGVHWIAWDKLAKQKATGGVGFRDFQAFNISLLAKQAWRLIHEPEALWVKLLKALYFPYTDALRARKPKKASWAWASIFEGLQFLGKDMRWNVGNGRNINIWGEKWIPKKKDYMVKGTRMWTHDIYNVDQLIDPMTKTWKEGLVRSLFDDEDSNAILCIPISRTALQDKMIWHKSKKGIYTAKEGYHVWMENYSEKKIVGPSFNVNSRDMNWGSIWGLNVPPKIKDLVWRACHDIVPTNGNLARRKQSRRTCCDRCGEIVETTEHALFLCPTSIAVWRASIFSYTPSVTGFNSIAKWWLAIVEMSKKNSKPLNFDLIAFLLWEIWKCRNRMIFEQTKEDPIRIWKLAEENYNEFLNAREGEMLKKTEESQGVQIVSSQTLNTGWQAPEVGTVVINCDAAYDSNNGIAGITVVARNWEGVILDGTNERITVNSAFVAECLATRLGAEVLLRNSWNIAEIRSDCKNAVDTFNGKMQMTWDVEAAVIDSRYLLSMRTNVKVVFVKRNENRLADLIAKETLKGQCPRDWVSVLPRNFVTMLT